ncbi:MAG: hypothetical protein EA398_12245 [Deltaproteobacteria bacterium]|nr:MAG: hypothetical protein EA398_12245 [Deltaproteobacteria bacterium]
MAFCSDEGVVVEESCGETGLCFAGECGEEGTCEPLQVGSCAGCDRYVGCNGVGSAEGEFASPPGRSCVEDGDGARLVAQACAPGATRCTPGSEVEVDVCDACGLSFETQRNCAQENETNVCDEGQCVSQCEFIEKESLYVGCEYWGLELDQAFVRQGGGVIDAGAAPYAVIVSNVHDRITADVVVRSWDPIAQEERLLAEFSVPAGRLQVLSTGVPRFQGQVPLNATCTLPGQETCVPADASECDPNDPECVPSEEICTPARDLRIFCDNGFTVQCGENNRWGLDGRCIVEEDTLRVRGTSQSFTGMRLSSSMPIVAYQFNPLNNELVYSNDASLLYPTSAIGQNYWIMTRRQTFPELKSYLTVVGVREGVTEVTVQLPEWTPENPVETQPGAQGVGLPVMCGRNAPFASCRDGNGQVRDRITVSLRQYEVLNIATNRPGADLTGTRVTASRDVAVFAGSQAANAPNDDSCIYRPRQDDWVCEADRQTPCATAEGFPDIRRCSAFVTCCADHLEQQMIPDFALGTRFYAARSQQRGDEPDYWRVLATQDDTRVSLVGLPDPDEWPLPGLVPNRREWTLDAGEWFEVPAPVDFEIHATRPVKVGQFLAAELAPYPTSLRNQKPPHQNAGTGDPAFMLAAPASQYLDDYIFLVPRGYAENYVTITAPAGASVELNDELVPEAAWTTFGTGGFRAARLPLAPGVQRITASAPVGAMVHGYDSFVSYGYPAGLNFRGRPVPPPAD